MRFRFGNRAIAELTLEVIAAVLAVIGMLMNRGMGVTSELMFMVIAVLAVLILHKSVLYYMLCVIWCYSYEPKDTSFVVHTETKQIVLRTAGKDMKWNDCYAIVVSTRTEYPTYDASEHVLYLPIGEDISYVE